MKILLLPATTSSDPTYGRVLLSLAAEYRLLGHCVLTGEPGPPVAPGFGQAQQDSSARSDLSGPFFMFKLLYALKSGKIDIVHLHFSGFFRWWFLWLAAARILRKFRLVVTFQDYSHPDLPSNGPMRRFGLKTLILAADDITAVSHFLHDVIRKYSVLGRRPCRVVPNGAAISAQAGIVAAPDRDESYILSAGRLAPYKGHDLLLMAYAGACAKAPMPGLVICGADYSAGAIPGLAGRLGIGHKVSFEGYVPPDKLGRLMENALFFTLLSRWESFGMAVLEAMSRGRAVLVTQTGGLQELVSDGVDGLLVPPLDTAAAERAMLLLSSDPGLRLKLGKAGRAKAAGFSWKNAATAYLG
ncbi:MAG: glycosyltransferase family 4 protein [bacterium]